MILSRKVMLGAEAIHLGAGLGDDHFGYPPVDVRRLSKRSDLQHVARYLQKQIRAGRCNVGALELSNLLQFTASKKISISFTSGSSHTEQDLISARVESCGFQLRSM